MRSKVILIGSLVLLVGLLFPGTALADGIIVPHPPICEPGPCPERPSPMAQLEIRFHHVDVSIRDQIAVTHVDQVFYNPNPWQVEGTYVFPIPNQAAVTSFTLWVDGQPVTGEVLDADQARRHYEEIVRSLRDPALLEYAGQGAVQAEIFPIPPNGERRIELEYTEALPAESGLVRYVYPLNTEKFSLTPLESVRVSVQVASTKVPLRAVYSPSHKIDIERIGDYEFRAGYEAENVRPDTDFALYYSLGEAQAFHLLSSQDPNDFGDPDGYFLVMLAPQPDAALQSVAKDVILVLDRSGSMEGEKFHQAQEALIYILHHLNEEDRFNIITFSTGLDMYAQVLQPGAQASEAVSWVERLSAQGSTDINRALLEAAAIADQERPTYLIFLTDGLPTEGVVDNQAILDNLEGAAPTNLRLFAFGVGYDVDTFLLDSLAQAHHGLSMYVTPGERLDEVLSGFYAKISTPVLTNLSLDFGNFNVYDLYPDPLPDLFAGSQIIVVGRYRAGGKADITLSGEMEGERRTFRFPGQNLAQSPGVGELNNTLPRIWATRKIGYLLNQVRLQGPNKELIDQIVRLSIRHGIVTPYTSYLVTEETPLGALERDRIADEALEIFQTQSEAPSFGRAAVEKAADQGALAGAEVPISPDESVADSIRIAGNRTFVFREGVWVDTTYDPELMVLTKVPFLSEAYFELADSSQQAGAGLALGQEVIVVIGERAYQIVAEDQPIPPAEELPAVATRSVEPALSTPITLATSTPSHPAPTTPGSIPCPSGLLPSGGLLVGWGWYFRASRKARSKTRLGCSDH